MTVKSLISLSIIVALTLVVASLAIRSSFPISRQLWDESVQSWETDAEIVPVRGWPLFFAVATPVGWKLLPLEFIIDFVVAWIVSVAALAVLRIFRHAHATSVR
jgi:hypothetical protein